MFRGQSFDEASGAGCLASLGLAFLACRLGLVSSGWGSGIGGFKAAIVPQSGVHNHGGLGLKRMCTS